jgi:hypothetical protein
MRGVAVDGPIDVEFRPDLPLSFASLSSSTTGVITASSGLPASRATPGGLPKSWSTARNLNDHP